MCTRFGNMSFIFWHMLNVPTVLMDRNWSSLSAEPYGISTNAITSQLSGIASVDGSGISHWLSPANDNMSRRWRRKNNYNIQCKKQPDNVSWKNGLSWMWIQCPSCLGQSLKLLAMLVYELLWIWHYCCCQADQPSGQCHPGLVVHSHGYQNVTLVHMNLQLCIRLLCNSSPCTFWINDNSSLLSSGVVSCSWSLSQVPGTVLVLWFGLLCTAYPGGQIECDESIGNQYCSSTLPIVTLTYFEPFLELQSSLRRGWNEVLFTWFSIPDEGGYGKM